MNLVLASSEQGSNFLETGFIGRKCGDSQTPERQPTSDYRLARLRKGHNFRMLRAAMRVKPLSAALDSLQGVIVQTGRANEKAHSKRFSAKAGKI